MTTAAAAIGITTVAAITTTTMATAAERIRDPR